MSPVSTGATSNDASSPVADQSARDRDCRRVACALLAGAGGACLAVVIGLRIWIYQVEAGRVVRPEETDQAFVTMYLHALGAAATLAGLLAVRRRRRLSLRAARRLLLTLAVFSLLAFDRLAGFAYPPPWDRQSILAPHPVRGWCYRRGASGAEGGVVVQINSHGFRGREIPRDKPAGEFRALFVGDSIVFGYGLNHDGTLSAQAERQWRGIVPGNVCVINAGIAGYSTWQQVDLLAADGLPLAPDLVVLFFCINDMVDVIYFQPDRIAGKGLPFEEPLMPHWSGLVRASATIYARARERRIRDGLAWAMSDPFKGPDETLRGWDDLFRDPPPAPVRAAWNLTQRFLDDFLEKCRERGTPMVLVVLSSLWQLNDDDRYAQPTRILGRWAAERAVPFLDVTAVYRGRSAADGIDPAGLLPDQVHTTERGNRYIVEALTPLLRERSLLPAAGRK